MRTFCRANAPAASASPPLRAPAKRNALVFAPSMTSVTTPPGFVDIILDGQPVRVSAGTSVFDAARNERHQHPDALSSAKPNSRGRLPALRRGHRRASARRFLRSPSRARHEGVTNSEKVLAARKTVLETDDVGSSCPGARQQNSGDCELETLAESAGASQARFAKRNRPRAARMSLRSPSPSTMTPCILCDRCIRGCDEIKNNFVLGRWEKVISAGIAFDLNSPMGDSTCIFPAGECMVSCPTGALTNKSVVGTAIAVGLDAQGFEAEDLLQIPVFKGVSRKFLELNRGANRQAPVPQGRNHCREGEFGSTAFYILEGQAKVSTFDSHRARQNSRRRKGFLQATDQHAGSA